MMFLRYRRCAILRVLLGMAFVDVTISRLIDLSFRHNVGADILLRAIIPKEMDDNLTVDVSNSVLRDEGVLKIIEKLLTASPRVAGMSLIAQSNEISAKGATQIFQSLLNHHPTSTPENTGSLLSLDLSWNHLGSEDSEKLYDTLEQLLGNSTTCPASLRLDRCGLGPAAMRAIGIGLIHRYTHPSSDDQHPPPPQIPLSLSLCGNPIGDAGAAALAAAVRFIATSEEARDPLQCPLFALLDLSACYIGDAGAEAIALALESADCCMIQHLDLSNNEITERGVEAICRGLAAAGKRREGLNPLIQTLDLSNNKLGDAGAKAIGACMVESNIVPSIILRSCNIQADGASALGSALRNFALSVSSSSEISLDLSGNPFGILRGKTKQGGGKYSVGHLKSKASATAASYMNQGFSFIKKGLKDVGVELIPSSGESDDEEEELGRAESTLLDGDIDPSRAKCGGKALSTAFTSSVASMEKSSNALSRSPTGRSIRLGLRHCFFDHAAAEALADMILTGKEELGITVELDIDMNDVLEEQMVSALHGDDDDFLREMAESHTDKMSFIKDAQNRAREAAQSDIDSGFSDPWNDSARYSELEVDEREDYQAWDSDADYENEDEI